MRAVKNEKELNKLGLALDPSDSTKAVPLSNGNGKVAKDKSAVSGAKFSGVNDFKDVPPPDESWDADQLGNYAHEQNKLLVMGERKSAIHAYRLGQALLCAKKKTAHGQWQKFLKKYGISPATWIRAKQLVERATEAKLLTLGITQAYIEFGILQAKGSEDNDADDNAQDNGNAAEAGDKKKAAIKSEDEPADDEPLDPYGDDEEQYEEEEEEGDDLDPVVVGPWKLPRFAKENRKDEFYTPDAVTALLLPYLPKGKVIWEYAWGLGHMARYLQSQGHTVVGNPDLDFLTEYAEADLLVSNPPFSKKDAFLERAYSIGKPFAMLLPADALVSLERYPLFSKHGLQLLIPNRRINFIRAGGSSADFNSFWYCWKLLPQEIVFAELPLNGQGGVE